MSMEISFTPSDNPDWGFFDCLDVIQLGFIFESLMKNATDATFNSKRARCYLSYAALVKEAIDENCGWEEYVNQSQAEAREMADYDGRLGWRKKK